MLKLLPEECICSKNKKSNCQHLSCYNNKRDRLILEFLFSTGCRISELCNLKRENLNKEKHKGYF